MCSGFLLNKSVLVCVSVFGVCIFSCGGVCDDGLVGSGGAVARDSCVLYGYGAAARDSCVLCEYGAAWCVYCTVCGG